MTCRFNRIMCLKNKATISLCELKEQWQLLHRMPSLFAYNLKVERHKFLPGPKRIYMEFNPERSRLRRTPQIIPCLRQPFDEQKFNFKKINPLELIMNLRHEGAVVSMIINRSPLTQFHTLICPDVEAGHAQCLTPLALSFSVKFLHSLDKEERAFRIGYNSPGALASVNHLHLQLLYIPVDLYIDNAELRLLSSTHIFRLSEDMPTEAICFMFPKSDTEADLDKKLMEIYDLITWLCDRNIPHNLFMTPDRTGALSGALKVFIFARGCYCVVKDVTTYNVGFCELSGYVPLGDEDLFNSLTEEQVLSKIRSETGNVYKQVYKYFLK